MATVAPKSGLLAWISAHRWGSLGVLAIIALAAALGIATLRPGEFADQGQRLSNNIGQVVSKGADTVAQLFDSRSPGERASGLLASLKHRRAPVLHERALPKVRKPESPYAALVPTPPNPPTVPVPPAAAAPLFNTVSAPPATPAETAPVIPFFSPPGGVPGGPGIVLPPIVNTPSTPGTPGAPGTPTPGVPEPATWAMMLLGFAFIGYAQRRRATPQRQSA